MPDLHVDSTKDDSMRVAVMGAGAVGSFYGGLLARAGHSVVLIGRPDHVEAVERDGLRMQWADGVEQVRLAATTDPAGASGAEVVLVTVKSPDSHEVARQLAPHLGPGTLVLSLQNGIDNAQRLAQAFAEHGAPADVVVIPVVVYVAVRLQGAGHVRHLGGGRVIFGAGSRADQLAELFEAVGSGVQIVPDIRGALWAKLVANCVWNPLSAITSQSYGQLAAVDGVARVVTDVVAECRAVAAAEGVAMPDDLDDQVRSLPATMPHQLSSTQQDLVKGRPTEIEYLNGYVVRRGHTLGVPTPVTGALAALVRALDTTRHTH
ncbi:MAG: ketopantoate reductase family protein [Dermatophilaceae bacterium]